MRLSSVGKYRAVLGDLTQMAIESLYGISCVDGFPDPLQVFEVGRQSRPVCSPVKSDSYPIFYYPIRQKIFLSLKQC